MHYWTYGPRYYSTNYGFNILSFVFQVLFWGLVIFLIIKLFKSCHYYKNEQINGVEQIDSKNNNLEIVKERYAKGEIDKKEFEQLKKDLG